MNMGSEIIYRDEAEEIFITKKKVIEDDEIKIIGVEDIIGMV